MSVNIASVAVRILFHSLCVVWCTFLVCMCVCVCACMYICVHGVHSCCVCLCVYHELE